MVREAEIPSGIGRGWWPIVEELQKKLDEISPGWHPIQLKEKFGIFRAYISPGELEHREIDLGGGRVMPMIDETRAADEETRFAFDQAIREAEKRSAETCEECGSPAGLMRTERGWLKTICPSCAEHSGEGFTKLGEV